jgi:type I restriction enzyme S subunit
LAAQGTGTTFAAISADVLRDHPCPIPPLSVQSTISRLVDAYYAEIDEGEAALDEARAGLETYRKSLLGAAVTGELTADWRQQNSPLDTGAELLQRILAERRARWHADPKNARKKYVEPAAPDIDDLSELPEGWVWSSVGQLFRVGVGTTPSRANKALWAGDLPWVSSGEVAFSRISSTAEVIDRNAVKTHRLCQPGTVLLGMIGEGKTRGQAALLDIEAHHNQNCASIHVYETAIPPDYVYWWLEQRYEITRSAGSGGNQPALNKERVQAIPIPVPSAGELQEITRQLQMQLPLGTEVKGTIDALEGSPKALRQSILAAAFRGELTS